MPCRRPSRAPPGREATALADVWLGVVILMMIGMFLIVVFYGIIDAIAHIPM